MKVVIIGLGASGFAAALTLRKRSRDVDITIIDKKDFHLLHPCGLPFTLNDSVKISSLKHPVFLKANIISNAEVKNIDIKSKEVSYTKEGKEAKESFDKLIIATGSHALIPDIPGKELAYVLHNDKDAEKIKKNMKRNIVIIGAGAIGLEVAVNLAEKGCNVTVADMMPYAFAVSLDEDMSREMQEKLKGIKFIFESKIKEIKKDKVILENEEINCDMCIIATGIRPNIGFIKSTGIKHSGFGITVNEKMETSVNDIYAIGDCVENYSMINKGTYPSKLANTAYTQGEISAENILGGNRKFIGSLGNFASVLGFEVSACGFNRFFAAKNGIEIVEGKAKGKAKPEWFGKSGDVTVKILVDKKDHKIIGAQAIGENAGWRINLISLAIQNQMKIEDLRNLEMSYCPSVNQVRDVLMFAVENVLRKI